MIEQQAMELYNRNIFLKFMNQLRQVESYKYKEIEKGRTFEVWYKSNQINQREMISKYIVLTDLSEGAEEFSCICVKFNKDGIFYSHILKVIVEEEVKQILEKYFIERWRKKEKKIQIPLVQESSGTRQLLRFNKLLRQVVVLTSKAAKREIATEYLSEEFKKIDQHLEMLLSAEGTPALLATADATRDTNSEQTTTTTLPKEVVVLQDPDRIQQTGRPKNPKKLMPLVEQERARMAKVAAKKKNKNPANTSE
jgi:hypothetical protein